MKILFATHNKAKLNLYKSILEELDLEVLGLSDLDIKHEVDEDGKKPNENAIKKAKEYFNLTNIITIADDTGLYFEGVDDKLQPGCHIRRINGEALEDEKILEYYVDLIKKHGGKLKGTYVKSIAIAIDEDKIYTHDYNVEKLFIDEINPKRNIGFPLDSISITEEYDKYTVDLTKEEKNELLLKQNKDLFDFLVKTLK